MGTDRPKRTATVTLRLDVRGRSMREQAVERRTTIVGVDDFDGKRW
jgi:hypothetical protein